MQTHFTHLFTPLRVRGIMFPNRIFLSPQGLSPKHRHPSSYDSLYDAGMLFFDKSQGCLLYTSEYSGAAQGDS